MKKDTVRRHSKRFPRHWSSLGAPVFLIYKVLFLPFPLLSLKRMKSCVENQSHLKNVKKIYVVEIYFPA